MTLLREIQAAAIDSNVHLPDLLRKCKVLAARLKHEEFATWVGHELNGYPPKTSLPSYRQIKVHSIGQFNGPFGSALKNAPIIVSKMPEEFRRFANEQHFYESVSELAAMVDGGEAALHGVWPVEIIAYCQHQVPMYEDLVMTSAHRMVPTASVVGILDTVRTKVLDFVLALEAEDPDAGETSPGAPAPVPQHAVTTIFNTTIQGGQANIGNSGRSSIGDGNTATFSTAAAPQLPGLLEKARDEVADLPEPDRTEALEVVKKIEVEAAKETPNVARMQSYVSLYTTILTAVSPTAEALQNLFGMFQ